MCFYVNQSTEDQKVSILMHTNIEKEKATLPCT